MILFNSYSYRYRIQRSVVGTMPLFQLFGSVTCVTTRVTDVTHHRNCSTPLTSPTLWNGMLLDFLAIFRLFFVLFCDFRRSSSVWMHLGALQTQENTGGVSWHIQPFIMACYFDFSAIFRLFFVISCIFHALRSSRNTGEAKQMKGYLFHPFLDMMRRSFLFISISFNL